ncbi:MAG: hypothetical protein ABF968_00655 [Acetobacter sp.]|uniref:hypothetical protein n=1 Tax=Acetobacter sp. TaxID=440 RepID=UPI0039E7BFB8
MKRKKSLSSIANSLTNTLNDCREDYPEACALTDDYIQSFPETNRSILTNNLKTPELITSGILVAGMGTLFYTTAPSTLFPPFYSIAKNINGFVPFSWAFNTSFIIFFGFEVTKIFITADTVNQINIQYPIKSLQKMWKKIKNNKPQPDITKTEVQAKITALTLDCACRYQNHIRVIFWFARFCTILQGFTIATAAFSAGWIEQAHKQYPHCFSDIIPGDPDKAGKCQAEITMWQKPPPETCAPHH